MQELPIRFKIPALPPSLNAMYKINYRTKSMYLDESARSFKNLAYSYIPTLKLDPQTKLEVLVEYHGIFHNKSDGLIKRRDGQNLDKCLYDVMFNKWGADDSIAFKGSWEKFHNSDEEYTVVTVKELK